MQKLEGYKREVELSLKEFLNQKLETDGKHHQYIYGLIKNILEYNLRKAKRIRPLVMIATYKCFREDDEIIKPAISIELMQAYLLIHDDIIDNSSLRRGKASMHKIYEKKYGKHAGVSTAILAGNLCSSYAYESIIQSRFDIQEKLEALKIISWINDRENYGQAIDILPEFRNLNEKDIWKIYELKTATYTTQGPVMMGCILAKAPQEKAERLKEYAYNVGLAFQIQDDLNGIFGKTETLGKSNNSDIKEGKKTLLIVKALNLCGKKDKEYFLREYGNKNADQQTIEKIRSIIKECGAYSHCKNRLHELIKKAKQSISTLELRPEGKNFLLEIAEYIESLAP